MSGPMEGIKVLDMAQAAAGPLAAAMLGDMGAEVIKVEPPVGDFNRNTPPHKNGANIMVAHFSRSKRGVVLDLKQEKDKEVALKMVLWADVFLENYKPGTAARLGFGYETLSRMNSRLIYCSVSGFGQRGPLSHKGTMEPIGQGFGGLGSISGPPGSLGEKPRMLTLDTLTATLGCQGILLALYERERSGVGQKIETSQTEAAVVLQTSRLGEYFATGVNPVPMGSASPHIVPSQAFKTRDRYIAVETPTERTWQRFCRAMNLNGLAQDSRFRTNRERVEHRNELLPLLERAYLERTAVEWLNILGEHDVPCGLVVENIAELYQDRQISHNRMVIPMEHPIAGTLTTSDVPWRFSRTPASVKRLAPVVGQHTGEVLEEFGYKREEVAAPRSARLA